MMQISRNSQDPERKEEEMEGGNEREKKREEFERNREREREKEREGPEKITEEKPSRLYLSLSLLSQYL